MGSKLSVKHVVVGLAVVGLVIGLGGHKYGWHNLSLKLVGINAVGRDDEKNAHAIRKESLPPSDQQTGADQTASNPISAPESGQKAEPFSKVAESNHVSPASFAKAVQSGTILEKLQAWNAVWIPCVAYGIQDGRPREEFVAEVLTAASRADLIPSAVDHAINLRVRCQEILAQFPADASPFRGMFRELRATGHPASELGAVMLMLSGHPDDRIEDSKLDQFDRLVQIQDLQANMIARQASWFAAQSRKYLTPDLTEEESVAAAWLTACRLGADCGSTGVLSAFACLHDGLCGSTSVAIAIELNFSQQQRTLIETGSLKLIEALKGGSRGLGLRG